MMTPSNSFQALHSPRGAFAHFALGLPGCSGGFGLQSEFVATQDVFIGLRQGNQAVCLPFFSQAKSSDISSFLGETEQPDQFTVSSFDDQVIRRSYSWASDTWEAPGLSFSLYSPVSGIPDPATATAEELRASIAPALAARLTIDNTDGPAPIQGFFAVNGLQGLRLLDAESDNKLTGWAAIQGYGFACDANRYPQVRAVSHFSLHGMFIPPHPLAFPLTPLGALLVDVAPGEKVELEFALGWYLSGNATAGIHSCRYAYTDLFRGLVDVLDYAVDHVREWREIALKDDETLEKTGLNEDQQFMLAHATRGYWASSMLFAEEARKEDISASRSGRRYRWAVNEGSFVMINTFDLAVDHLFFELEQQPWALRDILDSFVEDYAYFDELTFPGCDQKYPGGISFTHDQGCFNTFSPRGSSCYEVTGQPGCFSYMTQEQLINWIVSAGVYVAKTKDKQWAGKQSEIISHCLVSMLNRDHPDPEKRDGIMDLDSSRTAGAGEITTYDSLDPSLGQARRNLYLGVKGWAAYIALEWLFTLLGKSGEAEEAAHAAVRASKTIANAFREDLGYIPAILEEADPSPIIPAVEGLIFPYKMGLHKLLAEDGPYGDMMKKLHLHLENCLRPGRCVFPDGGWKLSARSDNSWISKIFLCQYIARHVIKMDFGKNQEVQDRAHADWWRRGCAANPGIDQIFAGKTTEKGFYYPRAITCYLWLEE